MYIILFFNHNSNNCTYINGHFLHKICHNMSVVMYTKLQKTYSNYMILKICDYD